MHRFTGKLNTMIVFLFRPSPQVPKPSVRGAIMCYEASAYNIKMQNRQMDNPSVDVTWIFLQSLFMAVNTLLWSISYSEVRNQHPREELEELLELAVSVMVRCTDRWPGSKSASELYQRLGQACLKAYDGGKVSDSSSSLSANSPASVNDVSSPFSDLSNTTTQSIAFSQKSQDPAPMFGYVFNQPPDVTAAHEYHQNLPMQPQQPTFRSNSIFVQPSTRSTDRRFSYYPPEFAREAPPHPQQPLPPQWDATSVPNTSQPMYVTVSAPVQRQPDFNSLEENNCFIQPAYNFGPQMYADQNYVMEPDRMGSLTYTQQTELMQSLESEGLNGIDDYLGLSQSFYNPHVR